MRIIGSIIAVCLLIVLQSASRIEQSLNTSNMEKARFLVSMMKSSRQKARNIQYRAEYIEWDNYSTLREDIERTQSTKSKKALEETLAALEGHNWSYTRQAIALDETGRIRIDLEKGYLDSSGREIPDNSPATKYTWSWDNAHCVEYDHSSPGAAGSAILDNTATAGVTRQRHPWRAFTGSFLHKLEQALAANERIGIEELQDGTYRIVIDPDSKSKRVGIINPAKGFSCTLEETYRNGSLTYRCTGEYEEVSDGVWFPVTGKSSQLSNSGAVTSTSNIRVSDVRINDPNFSDHLFHVNLPLGTHVFDRVSRLYYVVGEPMSAEVRVGRDDLSSALIVSDAIRQSEQRYEDVARFIPEVSTAREANEPFVLDLATGELVNPSSDPNSEAASTYLKTTERGDIAWDGTIIATRTAEIATPKQNSQEPLKFTKRKWVGSYALPKDTILPYAVLVITGGKEKHLVTIRSINAEGIDITCRRLRPEEVQQQN